MLASERAVILVGLFLKNCRGFVHRYVPSLTGIPSTYCHISVIREYQLAKNVPHTELTLGQGILILSRFETVASPLNS
jgi:hypothetical protein